MPQRTAAPDRSRARPGRFRRPVVALAACAIALGACLAPLRGRAADPASSSGLHRLDDAGGFPPIGMRFDHPQERGRWVFSYRYVRTSNEGLLVGTDRIAPEAILGEPYTQVPTAQVDQTHIIGVAYAPLDRLTFELSLPYRVREQDVLTASGRERLAARGIGDARFVFVVPFVQNRDQETHLTAGLTFPTGSIRESDASGNRLPYNVQLGSGTWDFVYGITYTGRWEHLSWGGNVHGVFRIGNNAEGYKQGTVYEASAWLGGRVHEWLSLSARMGWSRRTNVRGADAELDPLVSPANDPYRQGWNRLEIGPGANVWLPVLGGQRLAIECLFPIIQTVSGPQLERDWTLTAGFQWLY